MVPKTLSNTSLQIPRLLPLSPEALPEWTNGITGPVTDSDGGRSMERGWVFRVLSDGRSASLDLRRGDLLLARETVARGEVGILLPRGYGRPMLGRRTDAGLVAEPGGSPCSEDRWSMVGRLVARARTFRSSSAASTQVLRFHFPDPASVPAEVLDRRGDWLALDLRAPASSNSEVYQWLEHRLDNLHRVGPSFVVGECSWIREGCPVYRTGTLISELWDHFNLRVSAGVADRADAAIAAAGLATPSAIVEVMSGAEEAFLSPLPFAPTSQLGLFGAAGASISDGAASQAA